MADTLDLAAAYDVSYEKGRFWDNANVDAQGFDINPSWFYCSEQHVLKAELQLVADRRSKTKARQRRRHHRLRHSKTIPASCRTGFDSVDERHSDGIGVRNEFNDFMHYFHAQVVATWRQPMH